MILLIEDSYEDALAVKTALHEAGVQNPVTVLADGAEAILYLSGDGEFSDRTRHPLPTVILLDLRMPRVDGFQVLQWIDSYNLAIKPLLIVLSGFDEPHQLALAYSLGADSFLTKPLRPADVRELVRVYRDSWMLDSDPLETNRSHTGARREIHEISMVS